MARSSKPSSLDHLAVVQLIPVTHLLADVDVGDLADVGVDGLADVFVDKPKVKQVTATNKS